MVGQISTCARLAADRYTCLLDPDPDAADLLLRLPAMIWNVYAEIVVLSEIYKRESPLSKRSSLVS